MPIYRFAVRREADPDADIRWTHLPDKETAHSFANLLIKQFVSSGRYSDAARACLEVKDDTGDLLLSVPFSYPALRTKHATKRTALVGGRLAPDHPSLR